MSEKSDVLQPLFAFAGNLKMLNLIDRTINYLNPRAGLRRIRARALGQEMLRYEGARVGRGTSGWVTAGSAANAEIGPDLAKLRDRSRDLVRNTPSARKALRIFTNNAVGTGIIPRASTGNLKLNKSIDEAFTQWTQDCDADGQLDFYGIQSLIVRTERMSGETLIRFRNRLPGDGVRVPLQLQVMEPDFIDTNRLSITDQFGNYTIYGIRFDVLGRRTGYWLFGNHPGEVVRTSLRGFVSRVVPASDILHVYFKERPGQVRGVPWSTTAMIKSRDLDDYSEAELVRKKIEACLAMFVEQPEGADGPSVGAPSTSTDGNNNRIETFEPGMVVYGRPGETAKFNTPQPAGGFREYKTTEQHDIAAGLDVMYEQMTGDLSLVNYSSYRAGHLEFRGDIESYRWLTLIPQGLAPIWRRFIDAAYIAGVIPQVHYGVKWTPPMFQSIDPEKDANADRTSVRIGRITWPEMVAQQGYDPDEQISEIAATNKKLDDNGIVLDSDPRKVTDKGLAQPTVAGGDPAKATQSRTNGAPDIAPREFLV